MRLALLVTAVTMLSGCARDQKGGDVPAAAAAPTGAAPAVARTPNPVEPPLVSTTEEADRQIGKVVRVRGIVQREKLGDSVNTPHLSVVCRGPRLPDNQVGQPATVEGALQKDTFQAMKSPNGEISQGTEPGISTFTINGCTLR